MAKLTPSAEYSDEEIVALLREGIVKVAVKGQEFEFESRRWTMSNLDELQKLLQFFEDRLSAATDGMISAPIRMNP